ncbi:sugar phosphate isomerase/epimerase family protein [Agrococcus sp. ARC_14]|uniref:sugar phosphate isomerase/epimerase family protein n=1 Tax=Agrococcus sp. ARC_14 TaxID=2919927 RepID=UPI001F06F712|nr:sugar phosphate isomerase/epimerase family protein [Agrococcus sp. ARC_14]MCH1881462.1 sugar phosphate isomerase/epimerase [Agrococcus sp. ARC_14]
MDIGIGSYALFWEWHEHPQPLPIDAMIDRAAELGCDVFEICDDPRILAYDASALRSLRDRAHDQGVQLQLGTRGIAPDHLARSIVIAQALEARVLRSMVERDDADRGLDHVVGRLRQSTPALAAAGVTLALETYEQIPTTMLVEAVELLDTPQVGICLDPANVVAALELPVDAIAAAARHTVDLHVKDFAFARQQGWVGFTLSGARMGDGLLDLEHELAAVYADGRSPAAIVEHWLPWQGDSETTVGLERDWTDATLAALRASAA